MPDAPLYRMNLLLQRRGLPATLLPAILSLICLSSLTPKLQARVQYLRAEEIISHNLAAPVSAITGPPDSPRDASGAGTQWAGLGNGEIILRFEASEVEGRKIPAGVIANPSDRANFFLYEHQGGTAEPSAVKVEWRRVGFTRWQEAPQVSTFDSGLVDTHDENQRFGYYILQQDEAPIEVRLTGRSTQPPGQTNSSSPGFDLDAIARLTRNDLRLEEDTFSISGKAFGSIDTAWFGHETLVTVTTQLDSSGSVEGWRLHPRNPIRRVDTPDQNAVGQVLRGSNGPLIKKVRTVATAENCYVCVHRLDDVLLLRFDSNFTQTGSLVLTSVSIPPGTDSSDIDLALKPDGQPMILISGGALRNTLLNISSRSWESGMVDSFSFLAPRKLRNGDLYLSNSPSLQVNSTGRINAILSSTEDASTDQEEAETILTLTQLVLENGLIQGFDNPFSERRILEDRADTILNSSSTLYQDRLLIFTTPDFSGETVPTIYVETVGGDFETTVKRFEIASVSTVAHEITARGDRIYLSYFESNPARVQGRIQLLEIGNVTASIPDVPATPFSGYLQSGMSLAITPEGTPLLTIGGFSQVLNRPLATLTHLGSQDALDLDGNGFSTLAEEALLPSFTYIPPVSGSHGGRLSLSLPPGVQRLSDVYLASPDLAYTLQHLSGRSWRALDSRRISELDIFSLRGRTVAIWSLKDDPLPDREILRLSVTRPGR